MLEINRTADYVVLWKSHRRAERAALGLARRAAELRGLLTAGLAVTAGVAPAAAVGLLSGELAVADGMAMEVEGTADWAEAEFLEAESGRMWELYAELRAELAQVAGLLTAAQRQRAEKVIQQWEESGEG